MSYADWVFMDKVQMVFNDVFFVEKGCNEDEFARVKESLMTKFDEIIRSYSTLGRCYLLGSSVSDRGDFLVIEAWFLVDAQQLFYDLVGRKVTLN